MHGRIGRRRFLANLIGVAGMGVTLPALARGNAKSDVSPIGGGILSLVGGIGGTLGVTENQALGGTGALMSVARTALGEKFGMVSRALPGLEGMLTEATHVTGGPLPTAMADVPETFRRLGLAPEQVAVFEDFIAEYLGRNGAAPAAKLLKSAWSA